MSFVQNVVKRIPVVNSLFKGKKTQPAWPVAAHDIRDPSWSSEGVSVEESGPQGGGKQAILVKRPDGAINDETFAFKDAPVPDLLPEDQGKSVVMQTILISLDPTHRLWVGNEDVYMPRVGLNNVMRSLNLGRVTKSNSSKFPVGTYAIGVGGVQEYAVLPEGALTPVTTGIPLSSNLSVFNGLIGLTSWVGVNICNPKEGETMVVSGAYGAVGSIAAQLGKARGARVIGVAGGTEKCTWLLEQAGCDAVIDYKSENVGDALKKLAPDGVDCFFDNTGGPILSEVMLQANNYARIAICGIISTYNDQGHASLPSYERVLIKRMTVQGFVCFDHIGDLPDAMAELIALYKEGKLKYNEHIEECQITDYVRVVNYLFSGKNTGKLMMKIAEYEDSAAASKEDEQK